MTADVTVLRPVLPMTTFLTGNDVPKEYQTRACAAFALWLEQLGDGNAPLALLHMAEALKAERAKVAEAQAQLAEARAERERVGGWIDHYKREQEAIIAGYMARLEAVNALFAGGPDTSCRTAWEDGIECVSVPLTDLAAALSGGVV